VRFSTIRWLISDIRWLISARVARFSFASCSFFSFLSMCFFMSANSFAKCAVTPCTSFAMSATGGAAPLISSRTHALIASVAACCSAAASWFALVACCSSLSLLPNRLSMFAFNSARTKSPMLLVLLRAWRRRSVGLLDAPSELSESAGGGGLRRFLLVGVETTLVCVFLPLDFLPLEVFGFFTLVTVFGLLMMVFFLWLASFFFHIACLAANSANFSVSFLSASSFVAS
jgi:hypothetical protein